jgi:hypothetical protein
VSKRLTFLLLTEAHGCASAGNANELTRLASSSVSLLSRSSRLRALAARARTKFGKRSWHQIAAPPYTPKTLRGGHRASPTIWRVGQLSAPSSHRSAVPSDQAEKQAGARDAMNLPSGS